MPGVTCVDACQCKRRLPAQDQQATRRVSVAVSHASIRGKIRKPGRQKLPPALDRVHTRRRVYEPRVAPLCISLYAAGGGFISPRVFYPRLSFLSFSSGAVRSFSWFLFFFFPLPVLLLVSLCELNRPDRCGRPWLWIARLSIGTSCSRECSTLKTSAGSASALVARGKFSSVSRVKSLLHDAEVPEATQTWVLSSVPTYTRLKNQNRHGTP